MRQYYQQAREIIADIANSNNSCVLIAASGTGKSITAKRWLETLQKNVKTYAVIAKEEYMDEFCVNYTIYDHRNPRVATSVIENVSNILSDRIDNQLWRNLDYSPVRLRLHDWGSIAIDLQNKYPELWKETSERLSRIHLFGRKFNIALFADICTPDLTCVGSFSRDCGLKIIAQGGFGEYSVISRSLVKFYSSQKSILESAKQELAILREKTHDPIICRINPESAIFGILEPQA